MLEELGTGAHFWSNEPLGDFVGGEPKPNIPGSRPITRATLEVGVIAANTETGFNWWRIEEDRVLAVERMSTIGEQ